MARRAARLLRRSSASGPEHFVLAAALVIPLVVVLTVIAQLPATSLASPSTLIRAEAAVGIAGRRPAASNAAPPPTLEPPKATATAVPPTPVAQVAATPTRGGTYVVQAGDELKHIAAEYHVTIWKLIEANEIADPDSLKVGQELQIPN